MDLFGRGKIMLNDCNLLVIDEADRMLDMGFIPDIEEICTKLPASRQTLLFSATMPAPIQKLAAKFLKDPKRVEVARPATANVNIDQRMVQVKPAEKREVLRKILREEGVKNAIIFCNRKTTVRELTTSLKRAHFRAGQIHGDMEQKDRIAELDRFKADEINILVASDVAARGLDIKGVSHVFNFDVPWQPDDYIHRIGRTGRAGAKGVAITLATREDSDAIAAIEKLAGTKIARLGSAPADARKEAKPVREPEPKSEREERRPRPEKGKPAPKPAKAKEEPRPAEPRQKAKVEADSEWNGPLPSFLNVSAS
jgi:superfamily II DNA/RNA helicase